MKTQAILRDIKKNGIFGHYVGDVYTIEYQKRGLSHMHILIFLEESFVDPARIDQIILAKLPDPAMDPDGTLAELVKRNMCHGPCGSDWPDAPCMKDGTCSKRFPKAFQPETAAAEDGYPLYRRCNGPT